MAHFSDDGSQTTSPDLESKRFPAVVVALVFGQIAGDKSVTIAKLFVFWFDKSYCQEHVFETSLVVVFFITFIGVVFGVYTSNRGWTKYEEIVLSVIIAVFVALFSIIDQSLPEPSGGSKDLVEALYYLGWLVGLLLVPYFLMPNPDRSFSGRIQRFVGLLAVTAVVSLVCWLTGAILVFVVEIAPILIIVNWGANPKGVDPIAGAFFVVAFLPIWWQDLWKCQQTASARVWIGVAIFLSIVYSGVFPLISKCSNHLCNKFPWEEFLSFCAYPAVVAAVVLLAFLCTRQGNSPKAVGWPVSNCFWWFLPPGLAIGFCLIAKLGLAPLVDDEAHLLGAAHAINGILLGLAFRVFNCATKLLPKR